MTQQHELTDGPVDDQADAPATHPHLATLRRRADAGPSRQRNLAVGAAAAAGLFLGVVYLPSSSAVSQLQQRLGESRQRLASEGDQAASLPQTRRRADAVEAALAAVAPLPAEPDLGSFVARVTDAASRLGLGELSIDPSDPTVADGLGEQKVRVSFRGDFARVYELLREIEAGPRLLRVGELRASLDAGEDRDATAGQVQATLTASLFFDASAEK